MSNFTIKTNLGQHLASFHRNLLVFNDQTNVKMSWGCGFPSHGLDLVGSKDVLSLKDKFQYLIGKILFFIFVVVCRTVYFSFDIVFLIIVLFYFQMSLVLLHISGMIKIFILMELLQKLLL
jgi:hypothetical protein